MKDKKKQDIWQQKNLAMTDTSPQASIQGERLIKLNQIAIQQMQVLEDNEGRKLLK